MANIIPLEKIENKIYLVRGLKVMIDHDLAGLYEVPTKRLNEQVKRNIKRFPNDFMLQLTKYERDYLVANCDHLEKLKYSYRMPYVFTEQGVAMLSSILKSEKAIEINILIMRAFVKIRKLVYSYKDLAEKIRKIELKYDGKIREIYRILDRFNREEENKAEIGFRG